MYFNSVRQVSLRAAAASRTVSKPVTRTLYTTPRLARQPTQSEEAVKHEKHEMTPEEMRKQTAEESNKQRETEQPTHSEDAVHGERHAEDPLPDHKKKKSSKPAH